MLEEAKLTNMKKELVDYGALVENIIDKSLGGFLSKDREVLAEVMTRDEPRSNDLEIKLDEMCIETIAQYQPKGKALRTIMMCYKISSDLERMADHGANVAETCLALLDAPPSRYLDDVLTMAEVTRGMLKDSIDSFVREDAVLAEDVCRRDTVVDDLRKSHRLKIIENMCRDCATLPGGLDLLRIARNLERIADLCTNIGEDVVFMVEGKVIKHHKGAP
jgi:phosphate transport system protein